VTRAAVAEEIKPQVLGTAGWIDLSQQVNLSILLPKVGCPSWQQVARTEPLLDAGKPLVQAFSHGRLRAVQDGPHGGRASYDTVLRLCIAQGTTYPEAPSMILRIRLAKASTANGFVIICIPGSKKPFAMAALPA
jgi:hypothetical protein